jgi:hypothetical protein
MKSITLVLALLSLISFSSCEKSEDVKGCEFYDIKYCDPNDSSLCVLFRSDGTFIYKIWSGGKFTTSDCIIIDTNIGDIEILQVTNKAIKFYYFQEYTYTKI